MKKLLALLLAITLIISLIGCTDQPDPTDPSQTRPQGPTDSAPTDPVPTDPAPTDPAPTDPTPTDPAPTDPEEPDDGYPAWEERAKAIWTTAGKDAILATAQLADPFADPIWADAVVLERFMDPFTQAPADGISTKIRMLWDDSYLYVAYENFDNTIDDLRAPGVNAEGSWWDGNSADVETFLATSLTDTMYGYFTNPQNHHFRYIQLFHQRYQFDDTSIDYDTQSQIINVGDVNQDRWIVIQAISFESLGITEPVGAETELYGTFFRAEYIDDFAYLGWNGSNVWDMYYMRPIKLIGKPTA